MALRTDGHGNFHIPGARRLVAVLDDAMKAMLASLAVLASDSKESAALHGQYRLRLHQLPKARLAIVDDMISDETIASMTSSRPASGDGFHLLIMDLHTEINRLQSEISTEVIEGAKAYGVTEADRSLITAFMTGVNRTAPLKFDHPGLATTAARSGSTLLIQKDLGTTDAHVLVVRVTETSAVVTHTDIHVQRLRFFQSLLAETRTQWDELRSHQGSVIAKGDLFYVARGRPMPSCGRASCCATMCWARLCSVDGLGIPSKQATFSPNLVVQANVMDGAAMRARPTS